MARKGIEALFAYVIPLDVGDDSLRCDLFPMLDHPSMKIAEIPEVPIETAARDAELARKHIHLQSTDALVGERCQSEINPVVGRQPFSHEPTIQQCIDFPKGRGTVSTIHSGMGGGECGTRSLRPRVRTSRCSCDWHSGRRFSRQ